MGWERRKREHQHAGTYSMLIVLGFAWTCKVVTTNYITVPGVLEFKVLPPYKTRQIYM